LPTVREDAEAQEKGQHFNYPLTIQGDQNHTGAPGSMATGLIAAEGVPNVVESDPYMFRRGTVKGKP